MMKLQQLILRATRSLGRAHASVRRSRGRLSEREPDHGHAGLSAASSRLRRAACSARCASVATRSRSSSVPADVTDVMRDAARRRRASASRSWPTSAGVDTGLTMQVVYHLWSAAHARLAARHRRRACRATRRACPPSPSCGTAPSGPSARPTTCSASSSRATATCAASTCRPTTSASRCARTSCCPTTRHARRARASAHGAAHPAGRAAPTGAAHEPGDRRAGSRRQAPACGRERQRHPAEARCRMTAERVRSLDDPDIWVNTPATIYDAVPPLSATNRARGRVLSPRATARCWSTSARSTHRPTACCASCSRSTVSASSTSTRCWAISTAASRRSARTATGTRPSATATRSSTWRRCSPRRCR